MLGKFRYFIVFVSVAVAIEVPRFAHSIYAMTGSYVGSPASFGNSTTFWNPQYWLLCIVDQFVGCLDCTILIASDDWSDSRMSNNWCYQAISKRYLNCMDVLVCVADLTSVLQRFSASLESQGILCLLFTSDNFPPSWAFSAVPALPPTW